MISPRRLPHVPDISHVPFWILAMLEGLELRGETIRAELRVHCVQRTNQSFYELTTRLEERGLIVSRWSRDGIRGRSGAKKVYRLTPEGQRALENGCAFYSRPAPVLVR